MNLRALNFSHIRLISLYWSRYAVRSGSGLVYLMIALILGLSVAHVFIMPVEQLIAHQKKDTGDVDAEAVRNLIVDVGKPVVQFVLGQKTFQELAMEGSVGPGPGRARDGAEGGAEAAEPATDFDRWTYFLMEKRPALLSAIFMVLLFSMPFVISFLAYNQVSGDVQSHGLRYLLLRTERSSIFFGRFLGVFVFSTAVMAIIVATITFYLGMKTRIYPAGDLVGWAVHGFLALSILMAPYIAVCSLISALVDSPFLSLVLAKGVIAGVPFFGLLGGMVYKPVKYVMYALPWGWQSNLLGPDAVHWFGGALACVAYTGLFLMLGHYVFTRRDL